MLAPLFDEVEERFAVYVFELRQILKLHNLPVEGEDAVRAIAGSLARSATLRLSMARMMRAMIRREREQISSVELLAVLMRAAGHEPAERADEREEAAVEELLGFILEVRYPESPGAQAVEEESRGPVERRVEAAGPGVAAAEAVGREVPVARRQEPAAEPQRRMPREAPVVRPDARPEAYMAREAPVVTREMPVARREVAFAARETPLFEESYDEREGTRRRMVLIAACAALIGFGIPLAVHQRAGSAKPAVAAVASDASGGGAAEGVTPAGRGARSVGHRGWLGGRPAAGAADAVTADASTRGIRERERTGVSNPAPAGLREPARGAVRGGVSEARGVAAPVVREGGAAARSGIVPAGGGTAGSRAAVVPVSLGVPGGMSRGGGVRADGRGFVRSASAGIMAGNVISSPSPAYPAEAVSAGVEGEVKVRAVVGRDGNVTEARVVSGPPLLRAAAVQAVEQWQYRPYLVDGKPAAMGTTAIVEFRLPGIRD